MNVLQKNWWGSCSQFLWTAPSSFSGVSVTSTVEVGAKVLSKENNINLYLMMHVESTWLVGVYLNDRCPTMGQRPAYEASLLPHVKITTLALSLPNQFPQFPFHSLIIHLIQYFTNVLGLVLGLYSTKLLEKGNDNLQESSSCWTSFRPQKNSWKRKHICMCIVRS